MEGANMGMAKVFISHATGESELARLLKEQIEADFIGLIQVFVSSDGASIVVGTTWLNDIVGKLGSADIYVALCSQDSVDRPWINIELGAALSRGKKIIPIYHTDLTVETFQRRPLSDYEGFNAHDAEGLRSLYSVFQQAIGSRMPTVDFAALASKVEEFEARYVAQKATISESTGTRSTRSVSLQLPDPRVLCVSSEQFREVVRDDLQLILSAFPDRADHEVFTTAEALQKVLETQDFDIIHVATYICSTTGDLVFSPIDPVTKRDLASKCSRMPADIFAGLVRRCGARLVVLANNETLALVVKLLPLTSVIFALEPVDFKTLAQWIQAFYTLLSAGSSPYDACKRAFALHQIPMRLYPQLNAMRQEFRQIAAVAARS